MLPSQRALFDIPREVAYLNAASWSPLPLAVQEAGRAGVARKGRPWALDPGLAAQQHERARRAAARLINADPEDVAIISSVAYGVATAGKLLRVPPGSRVLLLADDHSSPVLEWWTRAPSEGFTVETVGRPEDGDWTEALLAAIERRGAPPVALASISSIHWSDGGAIDLDRLAPALRNAGAALLVDATHAVGVMPVDVKRLDPDFLVFPTYKWVLGPYGRAFLYVAKRRQDGIPLEQTSYGRRSIAAERAPYLADTAFVAGARRFDMGERDHFISLDMAATGMEMVAQWGPAAILERLRMLTRRLAEGLRNSGARFAEERVRAPHILGLIPADRAPAEVAQRLAAENVYVAPRLDRIRVSPHVYNDEADIDRFIAAFRKVVP
ncbi:MAG TPA: aminotransferase class V-fold PLP-dependent enzyme [Stellaceae bacterium]|nr:aminotransferase class V-fold PLP-dependent enzyme [Stellaceae bacterium]